MSGLPGKGRGSGGDDREENKRRGAQDKNKALAKPRPKRTVEQKAAINQKRRQQRSDNAEQAKHNLELGADLRKEKDERNAKERIYYAQKRIVDQEGAKHDPDLKAKLREKANHHAAYQRNYKEQRVVKETALSSGRPETPASITWEKPETLLSYGSPQPKLLNSKKMDIQFEEYDPQNPEGSNLKVPQVTKPRTEKPRTEKPREPLNSKRMDMQFEEYNPQNPKESNLKVPQVTKPRPQKSRPQNPKRSDTKVPRVLEPRPPLSSTYGYDDPQTGYAMQPPTNVGRGEQRPSFAAVNTENEQFLASLDTREDQTRTGWRPRPAPVNLPSLDQRRENTGRRSRPTGSDPNPAVTLSMGNLSMTTRPSTTVSHRMSRNSPPDNSDDRATRRPPNFRQRYTDEQTRQNMSMNKFLDGQGGS
ncbi:hypothetical protein J4E90_002168 [Alternaria incomplexa]|uniref:uncharacterized protein n=1 Tax=Alternaria incomplexa TaxID=1187928 RepID=UPI00221F79AF|nr:uncharacterized protein J4E90_002168 [Alternaria incomplexa]KAI4920028.1 hypothetical protein J4E90_002168 [Alternaria incomplexa]